MVGLWGRKRTAENVTLPPQETVIRKAEDRRPTTKSVRWGGETERGNQSPISHSRSPISGKGIRWDSEPLEASDEEAEGGDFQRLRIQTAGTSRTQDSRPGLSVLCFISLFCHVLVGTDFALVSSGQERGTSRIIHDRVRNLQLLRSQLSVRILLHFM